MTARRRPSRLAAGQRLHRARRDARTTPDRGVGIVEVLVAFSILLLVLVPISLLLVTTLKDSGNARSKIAALSIAEKWLETLNNSGPQYKRTIPVVGTPIPEGDTATPHNRLARYTTDGGNRYYTTGRFTWALAGTATCAPRATCPTCSASGSP